MESNYVKSARIKLQKLGITDYESFKQHTNEILEIIDGAICREYHRRLQESLPNHISCTLHGTSSIPEQKFLEMQTLEYYSRSPQKFINDYFSKGVN